MHGRYGWLGDVAKQPEDTRLLDPLDSSRLDPSRKDHPHQQHESNPIHDPFLHDSLLNGASTPGRLAHSLAHVPAPGDAMFPTSSESAETLPGPHTVGQGEIEDVNGSQTSLRGGPGQREERNLTTNPRAEPCSCDGIARCPGRGATGGTPGPPARPGGTLHPPLPIDGAARRDR